MDIIAAMTDLADEILEDYQKDRIIDQQNPFDRPNKESIVDIITKLQQIIFPGHFRNKLCRVYTSRNNLTMLLEDVMYNLNKQVRSVLHLLPEYENLDAEALTETSEKICVEFLKRIPKIREYMNTDVQAGFDGDPAAFSHDEIIITYPGLYAIMVNRIAHELYELKVPLIPRMMTEHAHSMTGIDIHPGATIGKYFFIDHGTGIVIGETTIIGENVKIYQGVTLGALSTKGGQKFKNMKRHPTIEDNVTIFSGAYILGGETVIGKDVVIGGNAFVTKSIKAGTRVSIKNQELIYNREKAKAVRCVELEQDENWQ